MPAIVPTSLLYSVLDRDIVPKFAHLAPRTLHGASGASGALQVVCAWPVSGQYGPGSRFLYYALVATCVIAQKKEWLRNACLAAALLFPAVAAVHGIVLASLHVDGAVDMDIYGAFQLCSIGILAAPVTVRLSRTYFYDPGRNTIFLWTSLILAGLLSLTVEFYRVTTSDCKEKDGSLVYPNSTTFQFGEDMCGLACSVEQGPFSPMRKDSVNNIYVISAPTRLSFGTATLIAAACCIPAILSMVSMWAKILEINWKSRFGSTSAADDPIEGTNGATFAKMKGVNNMVRYFLRFVEIPVFVGAVLAILITGERNFFDDPVKYQTEPIASVGQWAPLVGTLFAALGSLYLLLAKDVEDIKEGETTDGTIQHCNCSHHRHDGVPVSPLPSGHGAHPSPSSRDAQSIDTEVAEGSPPHSVSGPEMEQIRTASMTPDLQPVATPHSANIQPKSSNDVALTTTRTHRRSSATGDAGGRRRIAQMLTSIGDSLGSAAHEAFDDTAFKKGKALDFPEIPGEEHRNPALPQIREQYNRPRDSDGNVTPDLRAQRSRAASFTGSIYSNMHIVESPDATEATSPGSPGRRHDSTSQNTRPSIDIISPGSPASAGATRPAHKNTLEVPPHNYSGSSRTPPSPTGPSQQSGSLSRESE